jgi:hypothetical protein
LQSYSKVTCMLSTCQQGALRDIARPILYAISMLTIYPFYHLNSNKRPCMSSPCQQGTMHAIAMSARDPAISMLPCLPFSAGLQETLQETLQAIFFVLTRYPACRLHADKKPCMLFQCQQVYPFHNSLFSYITREMTRYFS